MDQEIISRTAMRGYLWIVVLLACCSWVARGDRGAVSCRTAHANFGGNVTFLDVTADGGVVFGNDLFCGVFSLVNPGVVFLAGSFEGSGAYGRNVLESSGITTVRTNVDGTEFSSSDTGSLHCSGRGNGDPQVQVVLNSSDAVIFEVRGVADACGTDAVAVETWLFSLNRRSRAVNLTISGKVRANYSGSPPLEGSLASIGHQVLMSGSSIVGLMDRGVVQMRGNTDPLSVRYLTLDNVNRLFSLGATGTPTSSDASVRAGNVSLSVVTGDHDGLFSKGSSFFTASNPPAVALLSADGSIQPFSSGFVQYTVINTTALQNCTVATLSWTCLAKDDWASLYGTTAPATLPKQSEFMPSWSFTYLLGPNNRDFPTLPGSLLAVESANLPPSSVADDNAMHAFFTGVFGSVVGNLVTHDNGVALGYRVAQIATTMHRPSQGYQDTFNYFDPDNYFTTMALLTSYDPYLHHEVRRVLERTGAFINDKGQVPHHFVGVTPVFQALSGATQTGPNIFWILSCLNYVKYSGDMHWLRSYMPTLRLASSFLFDLLDASRSLLSAPGSLYIDVFIRANFTSDSNGMAVGFLREFAAAEEALGNHSGAQVLIQLADTIAAAMHQQLVADTADHFITQRNWDNTTRDFVDYDANLISLANGVVTNVSFAERILQRIDSGRCTHGRATFVSERYYGPQDCVNGNIGDSWCSMGRNGWFDALTRARYGDVATFYDVIYKPLADDLREFTWLWERYNCDGTPQLNRTWAYFEYPAVVAAMTASIQYGLMPTLSRVVIDAMAARVPASLRANFSFYASQVLLAWEWHVDDHDQWSVLLNVQLPHNSTLMDDGISVRLLTLRRLPTGSTGVVLDRVSVCPLPPSFAHLIGADWSVDDVGSDTVTIPVALPATINGTPCQLHFRTMYSSSASASGSSGSSDSSSDSAEAKRTQLIGGSTFGAVAVVAIVVVVLRWRAQSRVAAAVMDDKASLINSVT